MRELFIDIETAPLYEGIEGYPEVLRNKLMQKYPEDGYLKAGLHAEFARIVCISAGYSDGGVIHLKSYTNDKHNISSSDASEVQLLRHFINDCCTKRFKYVGHNILEFDLPFIQRRMVINGIKIPNSLKTSGKKPWDLEAQFADTMVMWSGTQWKHRVSLNVLCRLLGVESPKTDMDGSIVGEAFYNGEIDRIAKYCEADVEATSKVYRALKSLGM